MKNLIKVIKLGFTYLLYKGLLGVIDVFKKYCLIRKKRKQDKKHKTRRERKEYKGKCAPINSPVYYKPDPTIYSQHYLRKKGLAVTWDNPDIQLYKDGLPISSKALIPNTEYEIEARIWNASYEAPVVGMPVVFSFLDFGAGRISRNIGVTQISLGVMGGSDNPNFARMKWKTPSEVGHYCLQVKLNWEDDKNPENNLGQENTNVVRANSPAIFDFKVENGDKRHKFFFEVDTYTIPEQQECNDKNPLTEKDVLEIHNKDNYPIPEGWNVEFTPSSFGLEPFEDKKIDVKITPPDDFFGTQPFNINVYTGDGNLTGGVTVYVEKI